MSEASEPTVTPYAWYVLWVLFAVNTVNYVDRQILSILQESIREDLALSDTQLGFLQMGFSTFYVLAGFPIARLADRGNRRTIIAVGIALFGAVTSLCGAAQSFVQLALGRIGVGVGEAAVGPAAGSMISDYFPLSRRASAFAVNAAAIHIGIFLGFAIGGWIAQDHGWRWAFLIAGIPGVVMASVVALTVREPERGAMDPTQAEAQAPPLGRHHPDACPPAHARTRHSDPAYVHDAHRNRPRPARRRDGERRARASLRNEKHQHSTPRSFARGLYLERVPLSWGARYVESDLANVGRDHDVSNGDALPLEVVKR